MIYQANPSGNVWNLQL